MSKHQITCKSLQKSSKCQEFPKGLALFLGRTSKKTTLYVTRYNINLASKSMGGLIEFFWILGHHMFGHYWAVGTEFVLLPHHDPQKQSA